MHVKGNMISIANTRGFQCHFIDRSVYLNKGNMRVGNIKLLDVIIKYPWWVKFEDSLKHYHCLNSMD